MSSVTVTKASVIVAFKFVISGTGVQNTLSLTYPPYKEVKGGDIRRSWYPKRNIVGTKEKNWMERTHIDDGRRPTSKESTWRNPWREEKPRSTEEKMERRTGINRPSAYKKRRRSGGKGAGPSLPIHLFGNIASKNRRTSELQCGGAPSCWKIIHGWNSSNWGGT